MSLEKSSTLLDLEIKNVELHIFADASTKSYGVCSYLRFYVDGLIFVFYLI